MRTANLDLARELYRQRASLAWQRSFNPRDRYVLGDGIHALAVIPDHLYLVDERWCLIQSLTEVEYQTTRAAGPVDWDRRPHWFLDWWNRRLTEKDLQRALPLDRLRGYIRRRLMPWEMVQEAGLREQVVLEAIAMYCRQGKLPKR